MHKGFRNRLAVPVSALAIAFATSAHAQDSDDAQPADAGQSGGTAVAQAETAQAESSIVITGTRIRNIGMESPTPVTSLSATDIGNIAPSGVVDALDRLPSFLNSANTSTDSSSGVSDAGGTNLNLRGLGTARTLTLLNGRRVVPNNKEGTVNIDIIPSLLINRLDIVTGGASAAYGTDAVAGVVNFLLDTNFDGLRGNVQGGISGRGDNENGRLELVYGTRIGDRVQVVLSGDYSRAQGIDGWEDRSWQQGGSLITNPNRAAGGPALITVLDTVGTSFTCGGLIASPNAAINRLEFLPDGNVQRFVTSSVSVFGPGTNNAQSLASGGGSGCDPARTRNRDAGPAVSPDREQAHLYGYFGFDVTPNVTLFAEGLFSHDWSNLGPSASTMVAPWNATIFVDNAFLPESVRQSMIAAGTQSFTFQRLLTDLYPDSNTYLRNRTVQLTGGLEADLATGGLMDGWHVQAYGSWGQNRQRVQFYGKEQISTIYVAIDAVRAPDGSIVCRAALLNPAQFGDCVPLNLFGQGNASPSAIDYVTTPLEGEQDAITFFYILDQWNVEASTSGEVWGGWGAGPITAAFGASYREQSLTSFETGLGAMFNTPTNAVPGVRGIPGSIAGDPDVHLFDSFADVEGSFNVKEAFVELNVPIIADSPMFDQLTFNGAVRWADYSGSGTIWSYKAGLDWQVTDDFRLRGTYSRDVRAATLSERFDIQQTNGSVTNDPVTGQTYNFSQTTGGNPNVDPEKADTFTVGAVLQPSWLPGFAASVDYFSVSISDAIGQLGTQNIVVQCAAGAQELCDLITRDPTTQLITGLRNVFINIAEEKAEGLDVELSYSSRLSLLGGEESLRLRALGSFLFERSLQLPGAPPLELDGQLAVTTAGDFFSYPRFQGTANANYLNGPFGLFLQGRYISGGHLNNLYVEGVNVDDNDVGSVLYVDLGLNYKIIDTPSRDVELYAFVTNLFDVHPPLAPQPFAALGGSSHTNLQLYDFIGQRFLIGARFEF